MPGLEDIPDVDLFVVELDDGTFMVHHRRDGDYSNPEALAAWILDEHHKVHQCSGKTIVAYTIVGAIDIETAAADGKNIETDFRIRKKKDKVQGNSMLVRKDKKGKEDEIDDEEYIVEVLE